MFSFAQSQSIAWSWILHLNKIILLAGGERRHFVCVSKRICFQDEKKIDMKEQERYHFINLFNFSPGHD